MSPVLPMITRQELVSLVSEVGARDDVGKRLLVRVEPEHMAAFCGLFSGSMDALVFQLLSSWFPIPDGFAPEMVKENTRVVIAVHLKSGVLEGYLWPHMQSQFDQPDLRYLPVTGLGHIVVGIGPKKQRKEAPAS